MNMHTPAPLAYEIRIEDLEGPVRVWRDDVLLAETTRARAMYETRTDPVIYIPVEAMRVPLAAPGELKTFCPFKGVARYRDLHLDGEVIADAVWSYEDPLPESENLRGYLGFMPGAEVHFELGENALRDREDGHIGGPLVDWLLRGAASHGNASDFTAALAEKLNESGLAIGRLSLMIWSLHPLIVARNYVWKRGEPGVQTFAPEWETRSKEKFLNSPMHFVSQGLGGVRQKLDDAHYRETFPIMAELKEQGATDYVAMPLTFSDGRRNVLTLTTDREGGFSTAELGLIFECSAVIARFYEVFSQTDNARTLLETYVGKRTGARVLGGEIRRGEGDQIDAAIMFCDLRGSTRLEAEMDRALYIDLLNGFFEVASTIVEAHGGEVLKFIGDAVLAVFPNESDPAAAKAAALDSAREIIESLKTVEICERTCAASIGIAYGGVTYGNIGSRERLDFTVIGAAANVAARLGDYGKAVEAPIVATADVASGAADALSLGAVTLHNVARPVDASAIGMRAPQTA